MRRQKRNPDNRAAFSEVARRIELAASLRKVPNHDVRTARLVRLALAHVPATDHLWTRPAPSREAPGAASNSDITVALMRHGINADVANDRTDSHRIVRPNPVIRILRATLPERVTLAKREILADVRRGVVPRTVTTFADLHDYVDANEYGGWSRQAKKWSYRSFADVPMANATVDAVDAWIQSGALRGRAR